MQPPPLPLPKPSSSSSSPSNLKKTNLHQGRENESLWLNRIREEMAFQKEHEKRHASLFPSQRQNHPHHKLHHPNPFNVKTILTHLPMSGPGKVYQELHTSYQRHYAVPGNKAALPQEKGIKGINHKHHHHNRLFYINNTKGDGGDDPLHTLDPSGSPHLLPTTSNAIYGWESRSGNALEKYGSTSTNPRDTSKLVV